MNPLAKAQNEVAVMHFFRENTTIPVPKVIAFGVATGDFVCLGSYIIMEFVDGVPLDDVLLDEKDGRLGDVYNSVIEKIYRQIARIYTQLITRTSGGPYDSTTDYFNALVEQSLLHLRNNPFASQDEEEARDDYKSIYTLKLMAKHFAAKIDTAFQLLCDDLRSGNILLDKSYAIVAIIDWEFCYAATAAFFCSPPWWLTGTEPFEWSDGDLEKYDAKLEVFLELLEEEGRHGLKHTLFSLMRKFRQDGIFWYNLAIRESFPLAGVMRHCLDTKPFQNLQSPDDLEEFSRCKMNQR
ncbi:hypothetical protein K458DRAFT_381672 [Lentithecium fluviatile CBS 122367]|uniref:Aminoglycoside phosphotransferase domain-containing protein n=1 Tax=Lentithecium fluviatile CBS 122367 TaxID=1168545 RepID=A0A6G1JMM5_9PLEO|nr:hypothetical protein K458DRAFT_381672 [Lentithecium fluviatile CBS 122367]